VRFRGKVVEITRDLPPKAERQVQVRQHIGGYAGRADNEYHSSRGDVKLHPNVLPVGGDPKKKLHPEHAFGFCLSPRLTDESSVYTIGKTKQSKFFKKAGNYSL